MLAGTPLHCMGGRHFAASLALFGMPNNTEEVCGGEVRTRAEIQFLVELQHSQNMGTWHLDASGRELAAGR